MRREELADLTAFLAVAEERSFTRGAARLGVSQSALSHTIRRLEQRLGLRLLIRTTRSVSPTEAGERLLETLIPALNSLELKLSSLTELRERPAGTIRITTNLHAAETLVWPVVNRLVSDYPDLNIEISVDNRLVDIAADRFDAGVRLGEQVEKDMVAVRIGPEMRMAVVGSPDYLSRRGIPTDAHDLVDHNCINLRLNTFGNLYAWDLEKDGRELHVRVAGQLTFNHAPMVIEAALAGQGLACVIEDYVAKPLADGRLVRVLEDWCPPFPGYHLYYPSRRQMTSAMSLFVDALRYRGR